LAGPGTAVRPQGHGRLVRRTRWTRFGEPTITTIVSTTPRSLRDAGLALRGTVHRLAWVQAHRFWVRRGRRVNDPVGGHLGAVYRRDDFRTRQFPFVGQRFRGPSLGPGLQRGQLAKVFSWPARMDPTTAWASGPEEQLRLELPLAPGTAVTQLNLHWQ